MIKPINNSPIMNITEFKSKKAELIIDQYEFFSDLGFKSTGDLLKESALRTNLHVMNYIGKVAEDGNRLAAIEQGGSPLEDIAARDSYLEKEPDEKIPSYKRPRFDVRYVTRTYNKNGELVSKTVDSFI